MSYSRSIAIQLPGLLALLIWGSATFSQPLSLGQVQEREFGPLRIATEVSQTHSRATFYLSLAGQAVGRQTLDTDLLEYPFDVQVNDTRASGTLTLTIRETPQFSTLDGNFKTRQGQESAKSFRGAVESWLWPDNLIYSETNYLISSGLNAVTTVRGFERYYANVSLFAASAPLGQISTTPSAPLAELKSNLQLGDVIVFKGTRFRLTPPTASSPGQMFMQGEFQSTNIPRTPIAQIIATWPPPPVTSPAQDEPDA